MRFWLDQRPWYWWWLLGIFIGNIVFNVVLHH